MVFEMHTLRISMLAPPKRKCSNLFSSSIDNAHARTHSRTLTHSSTPTKWISDSISTEFFHQFWINTPDVRGLTATIQDKLFSTSIFAWQITCTQFRFHQKPFSICAPTWNEYRINFSDNCVQSWHGSEAKLLSWWPNAMGEITTLEIMLSWVQFRAI